MLNPSIYKQNQQHKQIKQLIYTYDKIVQIQT